MATERTQGTWHLPETYQLIEARYGRAQLTLARDAIRSLLDRRGYAAYHYSELERLSKQFLRKHLRGQNRMLLDMHAQGGEQMRKDFEAFIYRASAHAVAAVQSLHALPDILAHSAYYATARDQMPGAPQGADVNVRSVVRTLRRDSSFSGLAGHLTDSQEGQDWVHLSAIANQSKHRSVVRSTLNEDWTGEREQRHEVRFSAFVRDQISYASRPAQQLISAEYVRLTLLLVDFGNELTKRLRDA